MQGTGTMASRPSHRTATAFEQYVSGRRGIVEGAVFFLESGDHIEEVLRAAEPGDIVIAPGRHADPRTIGYDGSFREPGDEITLDGRHAFELQDYLAAPFLSIVGLTIVRQGSASGLAAFLSDADTARESGFFVDQLLSGLVLLDSRTSFVHADEADLVRVHVTASGEYRDGPDGLLLGSVGDERADVEATAAEGTGRGRAFARIVDPRVLEADLDDRPWLARYVAALDLLRQWDGALTRPAISGFGGHLVRALDEGTAAAVASEAPFLVTGDGEDFILVDPVSLRRFRLGVDAARAAECLMATGDEAAASVMLATELGRHTGEAAEVLRGVRGRFAQAGLDLVSHGRRGE
ncbi:MAG: hypothetical protein K0Q52_1334 [Microbacterium sp.]|jgi:hypothetical protein|nr:hypothetical protein [Microbacterium sp.]